MDYRPGSIVNTRGRDWIVIPSSDRDLVLLKPLGGSEEEITGIYLPLNSSTDRIESTTFPSPTVEDIGDISRAKMLLNAARLSFRNSGGPFRCMGKLSFRPRSYQIVPLIMALKLNPVRLLIADDVGVGKTIESLMIVKELLERREIRRFAILCLPHLCDQWQKELKDKFSIYAVIIRSSTQAKLDRQIQGDTSVYQYYPYQVISIDYIKQDNRKATFISQCPELIIVDEAHSCARPKGASKNQQMRYSLLHDIAKKDEQHLILITATPHSGKQEEFSSLLGLLKAEFDSLDLGSAPIDKKKKVAAHLVKRLRNDIIHWLKDDTVFPKRDSIQVAYELGDDYGRLFNGVLLFAQDLMRGYDNSKKMHYWAVLGLLRGIMSSPDAGSSMLRNKITDTGDENLQEETQPEENPVLDDDFALNQDYIPEQLLSKTLWTNAHRKNLRDFLTEIETLSSIGKDAKAEAAFKVLTQWIQDDYSPVVYCRYIATAKYLKNILEPLLLKKFKKICVEAITSEDPDDVREERIKAMSASEKKILIATDCLSEGINLQEHFNAVMHYDLPWNPNRLEQREGRIDRFGQKREVVKTCLLYGKDNPIDGVVLRVIIEKVKEIRKSIGMTVPFPEESRSLLDAVMNAVLIKPVIFDPQLTLPFGEEINQQEELLVKQINLATEHEKGIAALFKQLSVKSEEIEKDLKEVDDAIGTTSDVEYFVTSALNSTGADFNESKIKGSYQLIDHINMPGQLQYLFPEKKPWRFSFASPTPENHEYIGRNHQITEQISQYMLFAAMNHEHTFGPARAAVVKSGNVTIRTVIIIFRARTVIENVRLSERMVSEEMLLWGYRGNPSDSQFLSSTEASDALFGVQIKSDISLEEKRSHLEVVFKEIVPLRSKGNVFEKIAASRAQSLVEAHDRFRKLANLKETCRYVEPIFPMDEIGIYVILPDVRS